MARDEAPLFIVGDCEGLYKGALTCVSGDKRHVTAVSEPDFNCLQADLPKDGVQFML